MPASSVPGTPSPAEVLRESRWREQFLAHNQGTRDSDSARAMLDREWRYLGPLLEGRPRPWHVLDLACGSGPHALSWAERGAAVTGVDFDRELLVAARGRLATSERVRETPRWSCGDATRLPVRSAAFDVVFCNSLLEHVPDWQAVLHEMSRALKPGGVAVVYTTNRACPLQQEVNHFPFYSWLPDPIQRSVLAWIMRNRRDLVNYTDFPAIHWFTFPTMRRAFERSGLQPYDRLDLLARQSAAGGKRTLAALASRVPALKLPYHVYAISMALYGVKR